jgi:hypothetical protein
MKTFGIGAVAPLLASAGLVQAQGIVQMQVSPSLQEDWHNSIQASPGDSVDVRVTVTYQGTRVPVGFASMIFQPTVSNWLPGEDVLLPFVNGGAGSQTSDPIGAVPDAPGQYGRVIPFARVATLSTNRIMGHVNTDGGVTYLRIAQAHVTNWFGGPGNTTGGSGVNIGQLANGLGRTTADPPFSPVVTNAVVFKFGVTLSAASASARTLIVDAPVIGFGNHDSLGNPQISWYGGLTETPPGSISGAPSVVSAQIFVTVPSPAGLVAFGFAFAAGVGRRRVEATRDMATDAGPVRA